MLTEWDIYVAFRKAQANYLSRPYRLPKNWDKHVERMSKKNVEALKQATKYFNTKWSRVDPEKYFTAGFELFRGGFTYVRFFNPKIIKKYIVNDKMQKRDIRLSKKALVESAKFVKRFMSRRPVNPKVSLLRQYSVLTEGEQKLPVIHYIQGHIDKYFLVWLMRRGLVIITDDDRPYIPYIVEKYREYVHALNQPGMDKFLEKMREML